jgi:hypothetical protein
MELSASTSLPGSGYDVGKKGRGLELEGGVDGDRPLASMKELIKPFMEHSALMEKVS